MQGMRVLYPATAFLGAFLLFVAQPMAGKELLPVFGGSFMVWTIALAFFQTVLLGGYLIAHLLFGERVSLGRCALYSLLFLATPAFLPGTIVFPALDPGSPEFVLAELRYLARNLAFPMLLLSTTSIALQRLWNHLTDGKSDPGFLYGASNLGSLAGLLSFPLWLEASFDLRDLWAAWIVSFFAWIGLMVACQPLHRPRKVVTDGESDAGNHLPGLVENPPSGIPETPAPPAVSSLRVAWFLLPMGLSMLLSATTNLLTMDVSPFPLMWVLPLTVYLVTFIRNFGKNLPDPDFWVSWAGEIFAAAFAFSLLSQLGYTLDAFVRTSISLFFLYAIGMAAIGILRHSAPENPALLTRYYLAISLGGAAGSILVAFAVPKVFSFLGEFPLGLFLCAWGIWRETSPVSKGRDPYFLIRAAGILLIIFAIPAAANRNLPSSAPFLVSATGGAIIYLFVVFREAVRRGANMTATAFLVCVSLFGIETLGGSGDQLCSFRNQYGIYRVYDVQDIRYLQMGSTIHGHQILKGESAGKPAFYYHPQTPIGAFMGREPATWRRMGVVGLGAGVLAAYGRPGQEIDFFELDPDGVGIARTWFGYLSSSTATVRVETGDGRMLLRNRGAGTFDLVLLDAFSSDAIPLHLLTIDAVREFVRVTARDGLVMFHISNRHLDLLPILAAAGNRLGLEVRKCENPDPQDERIFPTKWVAMGTVEGIRRHLEGLDGWETASFPTSISPWTDRFSSPLSVLKSFRPEE